MMKTACLLLVVCVCATGCIGGVNVGAIGEMFSLGASSVPAHVLEGIILTDDVKAAFINSFQHFWEQLATQYYREVTLLSKAASKKATLAVTGLEKHCELINSESSPETLNSDLLAVVDSLTYYVSLLQSNTAAVNSPASGRNTSSNPGKRGERSHDGRMPEPMPWQTLQGLFQQLPDILESDFAAIDSWISAMYTAGWSRTRPQFQGLQTEFQHQLLFGELLGSHVQAVRAVYTLQVKVQSHVSASTWNSFEQVATQILSVHPVS